MDCYILKQRVSPSSIDMILHDSMLCKSAHVSINAMIIAKYFIVV